MKMNLLFVATNACVLLETLCPRLVIPPSILALYICMLICLNLALANHFEENVVPQARLAQVTLQDSKCTPRHHEW
jgi:hypothetical protein